MRNYTILIVDDDEMITTTLARVIQLMVRQKVITFNNPVKALEAVHEEGLEVDLVISDFIMPELNGIEFLKALKEVRPRLISILLTGYADKQNAINSINEIGIFHYMEKPWDNNNLVKTIENALEKIRLTDALSEKIDELQIKNSEIQAIVSERTASIRNLLDNAGQGFLSFGAGLTVHNDYSRECVRIFGKNIQGLDFAVLLYPDDTEQQAYLKALVDKVLLLRDQTLLSLYLPLLPDRLAIDGKQVNLEFRLIEAQRHEDSSLMCILTDVSEKYELENQILNEKETFKMIVGIMTDRQAFITCVTDLQEFIRQGMETILLDSPTPRYAVSELFRRVHTLKGSFGIFNMQKTVETLHKAEDFLSLLNRRPELPPREELLCLLAALDLISGFQRDMETIRKIVGNFTLHPEQTVSIDRLTLVEIENKMASRLSPADFMALAPLIRKLGYKKVKETIGSYLGHVMVLAERQGKLLNPIQIAGDDTALDPAHYGAFLRSLIHVFRNAVVHGIETPDIRLEKGKSEFGSLFCTITQSQDAIEILIGDDGKGIDHGAILQKALQEGIMTEEASKTAGPEEIHNLLFMGFVSTSASVDAHSGRGVGLSAVKHELDRIGATLSVYSEWGRGTAFSFNLPVPKDPFSHEFAFESLLKPAALQLEKIVCEKGEASLLKMSDAAVLTDSTLELLAHTVLIDVEGGTEGIFFISYDDPLAQHLFLSCFSTQTAIDVDVRLLAECLCEHTNIILGNSLGTFKDACEYLNIKTPYAIHNEQTKLFFPSGDIHICKIEFNCGKCCVGVIKKGIYIKGQA